MSTGFADAVGTAFSDAYYGAANLVISKAETLKVSYMSKQEVVQTLEGLAAGTEGRRNFQAALQWILTRADLSNQNHRVGILQFLADTNGRRDASETSIVFGNVLLDSLYSKEEEPANAEKLKGLFKMLVVHGAFDIEIDGQEYLRNTEIVSSTCISKIRGFLDECKGLKKHANNQPLFAQQLANFRTRAPLSISTTVVNSAASSALNTPMPSPVSSPKRNPLGILYTTADFDMSAARAAAAKMYPQDLDIAPSSKGNASPFANTAAAGRENHGSPTREMSDEEIAEGFGLPVAKAIERDEISEGKLAEDDMSDKKELEAAPRTYLQHVFGNLLGTPTTGWREVARVLAMIAITFITGTIAGWVALVCLAIDAYKQRQIEALNKKDDKFFDGDDEGVLIPNGKTVEGDLPEDAGLDFSDEMMARARFHQEMVMAEAHYSNPTPSCDVVMADVFYASGNERVEESKE